MLSYIIWNVNPEIFPIGPLSLRWYGLLFAGAFISSYMVATKIFMPREKSFSLKFIDQWLMYTIFGTVIGARLGHVLFYDLAYYLQHPLEVLFVWKGGLASHGAAVGLLVSTYLFAKKNKVSYLWILDLLAIVVALSGFFIRTGNLMNSEIYGEATNSKYGFAYVRDAVENIKKDYPIKKVSFEKIPSDSMIGKQYVPMKMTLQFEKGFMDETSVMLHTNNVIRSVLANNNPEKEVIAAPNAMPQLIKPEPGKRYFRTAIPVWGIPKHPTHIYEALFCLILLGFLLWLYLTRQNSLQSGTILGWFFFLLFLFRFTVEFIKNIQSSFEASMTLNMGQILSIPFILGGAGLLIYNVIKKSKKDQQ